LCVTTTFNNYDGYKKERKISTIQQKETPMV